MVIQHNMQAMNASRVLGIVKKKNSAAIEKLSSGFRINRAADDAAGLAISEKMRFQIRGLEQGAENINEGIGYCQTADGALEEIHQMLRRIDELCVQAANDTNSATDRAYIDDEIQQLKAEMDRICETTKYNEEYIFKCDDSLEKPLSVYELSFSGYPNDLFIYNETYDDATGEATYGGVAYRGKRYAWSAFSATMYDSTTGMFREGTYSLTADDGTKLTLVCENGSKPPQVVREFTTSADGSGIYVNNELISWKNVKNAYGEAFDAVEFGAEPYYFNYHGVNVSFTPDYMDSFSDVIARMTGTRWQSRYQMPTEETALYANFNNSYSAFTEDTQVKNYLNGTSVLPQDYILRAGDGTNGTHDGLWIEQNGVELSGSLKSWADLGITNWGNGSRDIWENKTYTYSFEQNDTTELTFMFNVINEVSKDSIIDALDNVNLHEIQQYDLDNHGDLEVNTNNSNIVGAEIKEDNIDISLEEEYELGRDYSTGRDEFANEQIVFDGNAFSVTYTGTKDAKNDGNVTEKVYSNSAVETNVIVSKIKNQIKNNLNNYLDVIEARYMAGASEPENINLTSLVTGSNITGQGSNTYLKETVTFDFTEPTLKATQNFTTATFTAASFASASIDFSGLGSSYQLADLIGMGFNSTCQTCDNHYSIQFTTEHIADANWQNTTINGQNYMFALQSNGEHHTLYVDVESMQNSGQINNGVDFTNAVIDIIQAAGFDWHFTQYATYTDSAKLYLYDDRREYIQAGVSEATDASFSPHAYDFNSIAEFEIALFDENDENDNISIKYEYDYNELFASDKLSLDVEQDNANGRYVLNGSSGTYELYDSNNPAHQGLDRYNVKGVTLNTQGATLDEYIEQYIRDEILQGVADNTQVKLVSEYAKYRIGGTENPNNAMVTKYDTPKQMPPYSAKIDDEGEVLRIQCSANVKDCMYIEKQRLSVYRMGLRRLSALTQGQARRAIGAVGEAINKVSKIRSKFGAYQNRLEHAHAINKNVHENTQAAESKIRDTDMADEMVKYANTKILKEVGEAMLAQANKNKQAILGLLQ